MPAGDEVLLQRAYYAATADRFDEWHLGNEGDVEHLLACQLIVAFLSERHPTARVLDIGGGTGRFYRYVRDHHPHSSLENFAVEPSSAQRAVAYAAGVPREKHVEGDATALAFGDDSFDYCTEFGVLHHVRDSRRAVREMCRVASKGVFLSDCNRYGQGHPALRVTKYVLARVKILGIVDIIRTGGKKYRTSERDGIWFPFSVFDVYDIVLEKFPNVFLWATRPVSGPNLLLGAPQVLLVATR